MDGRRTNGRIMNARQTTGRFGEDAAAEYLENRGFSVIARNWRSGHCELDIVAIDPQGIHFVEVRTRIGGAVLPQDTVDALKQRKVVEGAKRFLRERGDADFGSMEAFFDVIGVTVAGEDAVLEYIPQAYIPGI